MTTGSLDRDTRLFVYEHFLAQGRPPTIDEVAAELSIEAAEVEVSFGRLEESHVLVFAPGTRNIWMANPLSAFPTPFLVETPLGSYWGSCIWDAFGVLAMLGGDGVVLTSCADCGDGMTLQVGEGVLESAGGVAHFAVPARHWWDNIGYT